MPAASSTKKGKNVSITKDSSKANALQAIRKLNGKANVTPAAGRGGKQEPLLILVHADYCYYCKQFMPVWNTLIDGLRRNTCLSTLDIETGPLRDIGNNDPLAAELNAIVQTVPFIALRMPDGSIVQFKGNDADRSEQGILRFVAQKAKS